MGLRAPPVGDDRNLDCAGCGSGGIAGGLVYNMRSDAAAAAFGAAMQVYQSPLTQPGEPVPPGAKAYATSAERAKAANALFLAIADKYGMTPSGETLTTLRV